MSVIKRRLRHSFLLLEVIACLGLVAFFSVGLLTPYAKSRSNLRQFQLQLDHRRWAQLASMQLHAPLEIYNYLPYWESSEPQALLDQSFAWRWDENFFDGAALPQLTLQMRCDQQTPITPDSQHPVWRRLLTVYWAGPAGFPIPLPMPSKTNSLKTTSLETESEKIREYWKHTFIVVSGRSKASSPSSGEQP